MNRQNSLKLAGPSSIEPLMLADLIKATRAKAKAAEATSPHVKNSKMGVERLW